MSDELDDAIEPVGERKMEICACCKKSVAKEDQREHLLSQHLGPHRFWFEGVECKTNEPSMRAGDFKKLMGADVTRHLYEDGPGRKPVWYDDNHAVDFTHSPHLWTYIPASYYRP